jgi:gamma-tubulin complex component 2
VYANVSSLSQGVEGTLIRYDEGYDPLDEDQRLQGARWKVDPSLGELN